MNNEAMLNVRIDGDIKRKFDAFCADTGMNASVAVNLFVHAVIREKRIPFDIIGNVDPFYCERNQSRLRQAVDQLEAGLGVEHELLEADGEVGQRLAGLSVLANTGQKDAEAYKRAG